MYRRLYVINRELEDYGVTQLKNYDMMLRRLTSGASINAMKKFVDVVEPLKGYARNLQGVHYTSYSPYTRVADAAQPESETARYFRNLVNSYLNGDKSVEPEIISLMNSWKENYSGIEKAIKASPILKEIESLVLSLTRLSEAGMEAIKIIDGTEKKGDGWFYQKSEMLNEAKKTYGEVELAVIPAFEKLIMEAGGK
jgi:hexosaminidase